MECTSKTRWYISRYRNWKRSICFILGGIRSEKCNLKEGFVVKGNQTIQFLEEKLAVLGLNERESEEFIVYWLPKLQKNEYNYIRFATLEEINNKCH